ncbi:MAG: hypothetical protein ACRECJ_00850 [Limisphaerales bacterium]
MKSRGIGQFFHEEGGELPAPLVRVEKSVPPPPVPAVAPKKNVPALAESQLAQRIYNLHQKRKISRRLGLESEEERRRFQEYAKFLMAYVSTYAPPNGLLREDVKANLLSVVRETPGMMPGIGLAPVLIFGVVLRLLAGAAGFIFGVDLLSTVKKWLDLDEKREDTRQQLIAQGRTGDEIKDIIDAGGGNGGGMFAGLGDFAQYAFWGALLYFGWKYVGEPMMKKRRRRASA